MTPVLNLGVLMSLTIRSEIAATVKVSTRVVDQRSTFINVGEPFAMEFTVLNASNRRDNIVLTSVSLRFLENPYISPIGNNGDPVPEAVKTTTGRFESGESLDFQQNFLALSLKESGYQGYQGSTNHQSRYGGSGGSGSGTQFENPVEYIDYLVVVDADPEALVTAIVKTGQSDLQIHPQAFSCLNPVTPHEQVQWQQFCTNLINDPVSGARQCGYQIPK